MSFYLIDNNGQATYINNKYLRSRLIAGTIDDNTDFSASAINDLDEYPEEVRILISKIFIETPIVSVKNLIETILNIFSEPDEIEYRNAFLALEKSHVLTLSYLWFRGCINKRNIEQFLDLTNFRNRTETLLTYLEYETNGVNIFSQLEDRIEKLSNFKNNYEVYNSEDYRRINYYMPLLNGGLEDSSSSGFPLEKYLGRKNFTMTYADYKMVRDQGTDGLKSLINHELMPKWSITEYDYDVLLGNIDSLISDLKEKDRQLFELKYNTEDLLIPTKNVPQKPKQNKGMLSRVFGNFRIFNLLNSFVEVQTPPTTDITSAKIQLLTREISALKKQISDRYKRAGSYSNEDDITLDIEAMIYRSINSAIPELLNFKFMNRNTNRLQPLPLSNSFLSSFIKEFDTGLTSANKKNSTRKVVPGVKNMELTALKDRFYYLFTNTEEEITFTPTDFLSGVRPTSSPIFIDSKVSVKNFHESDKPFGILFQSPLNKKLDTIVQSGIDSNTKNDFNKLSGGNLNHILETNILITRTSDRSSPDPGFSGTYTNINTINNYQLYGIDDKVNIDIIDIDLIEKELSMNIVKVNSTNNTTKTYNYTLDLDVIDTDDETQITIKETALKDIEDNAEVGAIIPDISFNSYNDEPEFSLNILLKYKKDVGEVVDDGGEANQFLYGDTVVVNFQKKERSTVTRYVVDNFGTSCIQKYFSKIISYLNSELKILNGNKDLEAKTVGVSLKEYLPKLRQKCIDIIPSYKDTGDGDFLYAYVFDIIIDYLDYLMDDNNEEKYVITISQDSYMYYLEQFLIRHTISSLVDFFENIISSDDLQVVRDLLYSIAGLE